MVIKNADELRQLTYEILHVAGANKNHAEIVSEHLVLANLRGVDSHGVLRIPTYVENIDFFSRDSNTVGKSLEFDFEIKDGDWHHKGFSSKGDPKYEIWTQRKQ